MDRMRRIGIIIGTLVLATGAIGCAADSGGGAGVGSAKDIARNAAGGAQSQIAELKPAAPNSIGSAGITLQQDAALPQVGPKIIKTADVDVALKRGAFQSGLQQAIQIAGRYQGFVLSTSQTSSGPRHGTVVIRVPQARFETALADLKGLGRVTRENVSGQDVSQEFVDLQARLRNAKAQEAVLLRLMDQAQSVSATIRVEQQLANVQFQIERAKGQLRYLGSQTSMSTITVGLSQLGAVPQTDGSIQKAWRHAGAAFLAVISSVIVGAAFVLPIGLLVLMGFLLLRWWRPRLTA